ncbi:13837_t:CDS:2, partial [Cetraspora pellucida]
MNSSISLTKVHMMFGSESKKQLKIPKIVDDYNNNINNTVIINLYHIARTLESIQEHKKFRSDLVWDLINFTNNDEIQLRNNTKKKILEKTKWLKMTKHTEFSDLQLSPRNHLAEWKEKRE